MTVVDWTVELWRHGIPMMTCIGGDWNERSLFDVEAHEIAHMWFPMVVGSTRSATPGWTKAWRSTSSRSRIDAQFPDADDVGENRRNYVGAVRYGKETEMMRYGDKYPDYNAYGIASYFKPATVLVALGGVIGDSTLMQGLREYGKRWSGKHPMPSDFWNTMNEVSGQNLDWFWRTWYYETWKLDQAIEDVVRANEDTLVITVEKQGQGAECQCSSWRVARAATPRTSPCRSTYGSRAIRRSPSGWRCPDDFTRLEIDPTQRFPTPTAATRPGPNDERRRARATPPALPAVAHRRDPLRPWCGGDRRARVAAAAALAGLGLLPLVAVAVMGRAPRRHPPPDALAPACATRVADRPGSRIFAAFPLREGSMPYEGLASTLVTYAIIGCILLLTIGAILCFPVLHDIRLCSGAPIHRDAQG
jgi:hypothetical protein